jgi:hypothetical protein
MVQIFQVCIMINLEQTGDFFSLSAAGSFVVSGLTLA